MLLYWFFPSSFSNNYMSFFNDKYSWAMYITLEIMFIFLRFIQRLSFTWRFMRCIFDTFKGCSRRFVIFLWNITIRYIFCKLSTMILTLEERNMVNWLQFYCLTKWHDLFPSLMLNLWVEEKWILPKVSCLRVYPFKLVLV